MNPLFKLPPGTDINEPGPTILVNTGRVIPPYLITTGMPIPLIWYSPECGTLRPFSARGGMIRKKTPHFLNKRFKKGEKARLLFISHERLITNGILSKNSRKRILTGIQKYIKN